MATVFLYFVGFNGGQPTVDFFDQEVQDYIEGMHVAFEFVHESGFLGHTFVGAGEATSHCRGREPRSDRQPSTVGKRPRHRPGHQMWAAAVLHCLSRAYRLAEAAVLAALPPAPLAHRDTDAPPGDRG